MASQEQMAATMLQNLPDKTGKSLAEWRKILRKSSLEKHGQLVNFLKKDHGVTYGFANLIVIKFRESGSGTGADLIAQQYSAGKADLRPTYEVLVHAVEQFGKDVELAPKKAYVSLRRKKQFGLIQPSTKSRVDVGLNLPGTKATKRLEKSGSFNAMVSHRVRLSDVQDIDDQLIEWLKKAYQNAG